MRVHNLEIPKECEVMWTMALPVAPIANHRLVPGKRGRLYLNPEHKAYHKKIGWMMKAEKIPFVEKGDVGVSILWFMDSRRRDIDSIVKATLDAMSGVAYKDDKQITELYVRTCVDKGNPRQEITLWRNNV